MRKFDGSSLSVSKVMGADASAAMEVPDDESVGASLMGMREKRCLSFDSTMSRSSAKVTLRDLRFRFCSC
jgi:hypothetical protein